MLYSVSLNEYVNCDSEVATSDLAVSDGASEEATSDTESSTRPPERLNPAAAIMYADKLLHFGQLQYTAILNLQTLSQLLRGALQKF